MKTRDLAGAVTAILNFQNGPPTEKTQKNYNFVIHVNICIKMCVLMVNCIPNHTKCVDISPAFVIASIKIIKMATTENSKLL